MSASVAPPKVQAPPVPLPAKTPDKAPLSPPTSPAPPVPKSDDKKPDTAKKDAPKETGQPPTKPAPPKETPAKDAPAKKEPAKDAPAKDVPAKDAPAKDAPAKDAPAKDAPAKDASAKDASAKDEPVKDAASKDAPSKPEDKENKTPDTPPAPKPKHDIVNKTERPADEEDDSDDYNYDVSDSEEESDHKPPPMIDMGVDLDKLKNRIAKVTAPPPTAAKPRQKLTDIDRDKYNKFKGQFEKQAPDEHDDDFEKRMEEKRRSLQAEFQPGGKEQLDKFKNKFEKLQAGETDEDKLERKKDLVHQTANDRKRIMKMFKKKREVVEDVPKNCAICDKPVYPVEKIFVLKKTWHKQCFKCATCQKQLT